MTDDHLDRAAFARRHRGPRTAPGGPGRSARPSRHRGAGAAATAAVAPRPTASRTARGRAATTGRACRSHPSRHAHVITLMCVPLRTASGCWPTRPSGPPCDGTAAPVGDRVRSSRAVRTAPPGPVRCRRARSRACSARAARESGSRSSKGSPVASPGTSAVNSRRYSATVASRAWAADTQCIVDLTLRPSGAFPPRVSGSYVHCTSTTARLSVV